MRPMWLFLILTKGGQSSHMPPDGWGNILVSNISTPSNLEKLLVWYELSSKFMHDSVRLAIVLYPTIWPFKKISEKFSYSQSNLPKWHTIYLVGHHSKHHNQSQSWQMYHHPHLRTQWQHQYAMDDRQSTGAIGSTIAWAWASLSGVSGLRSRSTISLVDDMVQAWVAQKLVNVTFYEFLRCPICSGTPIPQESRHFRSHSL